MELKELLGKRVLLGEKTYSNKITASEFKILGLSPSKTWVRVQNEHGNKFWKASVEIYLLEILLISDKPTN